LVNIGTIRIKRGTRWGGAGMVWSGGGECRNDSDNSVSNP
jgi:hypothetical protein